ncbi:MAG: class I SAM-dependent RNA methyltransferase, partial [Gemmatimonadales bacterium]
MASDSRAGNLACFAITPPGVEQITARELRGLGIRITGTEPGGVAFGAHLRQVYAANLHLRTANRILRRFARFHAASFPELERHARRTPWETIVAPGTPVAFRVTTHRSRLYHQRAVIQRLADAVARRVPGAIPAEPVSDDGPPDASQLFVVRLVEDQCTVSADTSGELLHRRGYRLETGKAPLRETLAAAMLLSAGWTGTEPLCDPFCGSGTIPIEAALLARGMAPGIGRSFAFQRWPGFQPALWADLVQRAQEESRDHPAAPITGFDRDAGAVEAAQANAARAGVGAGVAFRRQTVSALEPGGAGGWIITNPPYGGRVGDRQKLRNLYAQFGNV